MSVVYVACAADRRYAVHSAAMLHSVLAHAGGAEVRVAYLHGPRFAARAARALERMVVAEGGQIAFFEIPAERVVGLPETDAISAAMWYRIFLPELLPEASRVLYLDIDTIARDDLTELWQTDLSKHYVGAVTNIWEPWNEGYPAGALGLSGPEAYFNSGVLLMNLDLMRRDDCLQRLHEHALEHSAELVWPDQDTLNVVLGERRLPLHPRWNCMNSVLQFPRSVEIFGEEAVATARRRPGIRHFEGPSVNKPWHILAESEGADAYFEHRRRTPWPRTWPAGVSPRTLVIRIKRELRRREPRGARSGRE